MKKLFLLSILFLLSSITSCQEEKKEVAVKNHEVKVVSPPQLNFIIKDSISEIDLSKIAKNSPSLNHGYGKGGNFTSKEIKRYSELKNSNHCFWAVANCTDEKIISQSQNANELVFGASVPKIILGAVAVNNNCGKLKSQSDWRQLLQLLVVSANDPQWSYIQKLAGGSDSIKSFCKNWQYDMYPEKISGANMISALGMVKFYTDLCNRKFVGSDVILKISNACSTSGGRSKVFMPDSVIMGSKTGTWSQYIHDTGWFWWSGKYWSIAVLTDGWYSSEDIAIMWGGLFREYVVGNLQVNYSSQEKVVVKKSIKKKPRHKSKKKGKRKKK